MPWRTWRPGARVSRSASFTKQLAAPKPAPVPENASESNVDDLLELAVRGGAAENAADDEPVYLQVLGEPNTEGTGRQLPNGYKLPQHPGVAAAPASSGALTESAAALESTSVAPARRLRSISSPPIQVPQEPAANSPIPSVSAATVGNQAEAAARPIPLPIPSTPRLSSDDSWGLGLNT